MADDAYDLRSNIKGKPGSQGTLFQVKDKGLLNPQQRWPRGYGPERQEEVRDVLRKTPVSPPAGVNEYENRAQIVDVVSRSTIPVRKDIRSKEAYMGLQKIHGVPNPGSDATYWPKTRHLAVDMRLPEGDQNLIHELGHHADNHNNTTRDHVANQIMQGDPSAVNKVAGVMEGVADNYMTKHYRTRGRNPQPVSTGRYEDNFTSQDRDRKYPGYNDVRPPQAFLQSSQFQYQPTLPEPSGQQTELQRRLSSRTDANRHAVGENLK